MADEVKPEDRPYPTSRVGSTIREGTDAAKFVSSWTPQQALIVAFVFIQAGMLGMLGFKTWADEKTRAAEREASAQAQATMLRFAESESERSRLFFMGELEKQRQFHTTETDKTQTNFAEMERVRRIDSAAHMKEAFIELSNLKTAIGVLASSMDKLKGKVNPSDEEEAPPPHIKAP